MTSVESKHPKVIAIVTHRVGVRPVLVFGPVGGVGEGLGAPLELAHVGTLTRMGPEMRLEVL